jgi:hypothetical protein
MKYYKIDFQNFYNVGRVPSYANGDKILNAEFYFNKISQGEILLKFPVFDYFFLESFDKKEFWEWKLCDVHKFTKEASRLSGWLISKKLKSLFEFFNLPKPYYLFPSKLLYKEEKLDYYIFQFAGKFIYKQTTEYINYKKSNFLNPATNIITSFENNDDYARHSEKLYFEKKMDFVKKKLAIDEKIDFLPMQSFLKDNIVSERLKNAIEENNITGFEFSELDYEVIVNE